MAASPSWQASTSTWRRARSSCSRGRNGAGKTSLLRACAGLAARRQPARPRCLGEDLVADPRAVRRRVGLLGHATALYDDLSAADNVRFAVRAAGRPVPAGGAGPRPAGPDGPAGRHARSAPCRPGSAAGRRWPPRWPATPNCGCSTSPTPASTPNTGTCSTSLVRDAVVRGATVADRLPRAGAVPVARRANRDPGGRAWSSTPASPFSPKASSRHVA